MSWQWGLFWLFVTFALWCLALVAMNAYDKRRKPGPPTFDERNWSINYMTDFKRWSHRG